MPDFTSPKLWPKVVYLMHILVWTALIAGLYLIGAGYC